MSISISSIAEKILSNSIDKDEAINSFDELSDAEKDLLISELKLILSSSEKISGAEEVKVDQYRANTMKVIDERGLDENHKKFIANLSKKLDELAPKSKENALKHQKYLVDQRKITNLKKPLKALQFHLTYDKAEAQYLYDIDGNKYIDITGDNGVNIFGHQPDYVKKSIEARVNKGFPLVGYTEELFEAAKLFCEITGHERVLFTQSGTEAVMWAVRIARAARQRSKIVIFDGSYHGLSDAVLAMKDAEGKSVAMGLGMLQEFADQLIILNYGDLDQLNIIEEHADDIAGVLVEPVQSRNPDNQPVEFLQELRKLTIEKEIPLIMDEMITGFRVCPKGAQGYFNVKADIATYGKIPGGGMPTGMIAGLAKYMNFVDGGTWNFDDDSMPSYKRTLMAGTHTRNPVKLAASLAVLKEIKQRCNDTAECSSCNCFQKDLNRKTEKIAFELNDFFTDNKLPIIIEHFSSLFRITFTQETYGIVKELLIILMRINGLETSVSGNFFLTTAHTDEDIDSIIKIIKNSTEELMLANLFYFASETEHDIDADENMVSEGSDIAGSVATDIKLKNQKMEQLRTLIRKDLDVFVKGVR